MNRQKITTRIQYQTHLNDGNTLRILARRVLAWERGSVLTLSSQVPHDQVYLGSAGIRLLRRRENPSSRSILLNSLGCRSICRLGHYLDTDDIEADLN